MKLSRYITSKAGFSAVAAMLVAAALLLTADVAYSASNGLSALLRSGGGRTATHPAEVLPPPTRNPKPFRQTVVGNCAIPDFDGVCKFRFSEVGANRLLEISNILCVAAGGSPFVFLTSTGNPSQVIDSLIAVIPSVHRDLTVTNASGPFYFKAGERFFIFADGSPLALCTVYGTISRTD